jgi:glutamate carboxypeptidase
LGFEGAQGLNTVAVARRGIGGWTLNVTAKTGHSAGIFSENAGYGAIYEAARIINEFRTQLKDEKYLTFNPGLISGGSEIRLDPANARMEAIGKTNIISPAAFVAGDLRFISEVQRDRARERMKAIVSQNLNGTSASISFTDGLPAMEPTEGNYNLVKYLDRITQDMGIGTPSPCVSDIAKYVDSLDGMGASGSGAHKPGELINLSFRCLYSGCIDDLQIKSSEPGIQLITIVFPQTAGIWYFCNYDQIKSFAFNPTRKILYPS